MTFDRAQLIKRLFLEAGQKLGSDRDRFLEVQCGNDLELRSQIERLLEADDPAACGFLGCATHAVPDSVVSTKLGRFQILRKIGEGGMGTVYEAEQDQPRRRVALKVMRGTSLSKSLIRRFEHEVQILGQLRHAGIAQVYEAGTHDNGSEAIPYFAMEYVHGTPLLEYAAQRNLTARQRLELISNICDAVQHAHQKGIIHRDLKPANILVEETEAGIGQPKVLDFGVARATRSEVQLLSMHTEMGQLMGTISYMSPEQIAGHPDELDRRTDVYALGVMMFELLVGRPPYDLRNCSIPEAGNIICEQEPSSLGSIDSIYRGDIETIVAKALAKERDRRYRSASELSDDIRRVLADQPIFARPATRWYQWRKFAKRNRGLVGGIAVAFVALLVGMIGVTIALVRATHAQHAALRSAEKAHSVSRFLQDMLAGMDPQNIGPNPLTVREVLDHAAVRLETELKDQPEVAASIHQTLGKHYNTLGLYDDADRHLRTAVELRKSSTTGEGRELADAISSLTTNLQDKRDLGEAEIWARQALDMRRRLFGSDSLETAESLYDLASILIELGRAEEAEPLVRESLDIRNRLSGSDDVTVAISTGLLGSCLVSLGKLTEAETAVRKAVAIVRGLSGDNELVLAGRLTFLANVVRMSDNIMEEEAALREAIGIRSRRLGRDHPSLAWNFFCLAQNRLKLNEFNEAETLCRQALEIYLMKRGSDHTDVADCYQLMGQIYSDQRRFSEAEMWWKACLDLRRRLLRSDHPDVTVAEVHLRGCQAALQEASQVE